MHRFKSIKALQIKLSTSNCGQVCITACGQAPMACHRWPGGGGRAERPEVTAMKGHVADGCIVIAPSGKEFKIVNTLKGWMLHGPDNRPCSGYLPSAFDVEYFVINGLSSN